MKIIETAENAENAEKTCLFPNRSQTRIFSAVQKTAENAETAEK